MCGISGLLRIGQTGANLRLSARRMSDSMVHRGPDDSGLWVDEGEGIALSHRRLSIRDVSEAGHQPMMSYSGNYILAFNGEIYNHEAIRLELEAVGRAPPWRGHSDTETLLAAVEAWGLKRAIQRCNGMFAVALWNRQESTLTLTRDRMGEKPIYLAQVGGGWAFASELKALHHVPGFRAALSHEAIAAFLAYGYVPDHHCIFQSVRKVPPGGIFTLTQTSETPDLTKYYELADDSSSHLRDRFNKNGLDVNDSAGTIERILHKVIDEQMISDVPLGCFLSGGVDSSLVAAIMQSQRDTPVLTFSIGFKETRFNEAPYAAAVARQLKTNHTEFILHEHDALDIVSDLPRIYDEPFADSSQIPTTLLCRRTRKTVTVALTGDGGDELFGGYNRHVFGPKLLNRLQLVPQSLLHGAGRLATILGPWLSHEDGMARRLAGRLPLPVTFLDKLSELGPLIAASKSKEDLYRCLTRIIQDPNQILEKPSQFPDAPSLPNLQGAEWLMAMDTTTYLPGDILVKVDRAAMASSLETRAPFLDARVITEAWRLPLELKIASGTGKWILRKILSRYVPQELINRPKQGFAVPLNRWLRGALREFGEELLTNSKLFEVSGLNQPAILVLWEQHQSRQADVGASLWNILTLLNWVKTYQNVIETPNSNSLAAD